ncbi:MAG TPA: integrase arm-type DNA-binding domain-containing protein [Gammaproteobacteria bacterium]|nr:integrase arm-type DNA-binding domain-containing protein [Gammaproteobacteria bacterium]
MEIRRLTVLQIKNASAGKHFDGGGLYLHVQQSGSRYWRMKYYWGSKERVLALGVFPAVSLAEARTRHADAKKQLRDGLDPATVRQNVKRDARKDEAAAFPVVAEAWLTFKRQSWAPETYRKARYVIDAYLIPPLKHISITMLTTKQAADALQPIAAAAPSLAEKARVYLGGIVQYAIQRELRDDGRLLSLRGIFPAHRAGHVPAATDPKEVTALVQAIDNYPSIIMRRALTLTMLTAMRPGVVASAKWEHVDMQAGEWSVPAELMKTQRPHIVPLPKQALAVLKAMQALTGDDDYVFPAISRQKTPHLHRDAMSKALREMGFQGRHATHGFRGMLRTVARERLGVDSDVLEAQLAHAKKGAVAQAYDRTTFSEERRRVMQAWADYLDLLRTGSKGKVLPLQGRRRG